METSAPSGLRNDQCTERLHLLELIHQLAHEDKSQVGSAGVPEDSSCCPGHLSRLRATLPITAQNERLRLQESHHVLSFSPFTATRSVNMEAGLLEEPRAACMRTSPARLPQHGAVRVSGEAQGC